MIYLQPLLIFLYSISYQLLEKYSLNLTVAFRKNFKFLNLAMKWQ